MLDLLCAVYCGGGRWSGHEISYEFGGWEVWVHGDAAMLYYDYANIVIILCLFTHITNLA